jgi:hypothetical protein
VRNRKEIKVLLDHCTHQRAVTPEISQLMSRNWDELDEQIKLLTYYLDNGRISNLDEYLEDITNSFALWILGYNTRYDDLVKELIENDTRN